MEQQVFCPSCGAQGVTVSNEMLKPDTGAGITVAYVAALALILWQGFSRMFQPYTTQSAHGVAVAMMVAGIVFAVVVTVIFFRMTRKRPCRVQRCPRCGHAFALDAPPKGARGWKMG